MSCDTQGKIRGFVKHEDILNFIKQKWDINANDKVIKRIMDPISKCDWNHKINEHSEDFKNWYILYGFIYFDYNGEKKSLFYVYDNINHYENLEYYSRHGLAEMVETETTTINLSYCQTNVEIIKNIVTHFGGGWIDENDCDGKEYYPIKGNNS